MIKTLMGYCTIDTIRGWSVERESVLRCSQGRGWWLRRGVRLEVNGKQIVSHRFYDRYFRSKNERGRHSAIHGSYSDSEDADSSSVEAASRDPVSGYDDALVMESLSTLSEIRARVGNEHGLLDDATLSARRRETKELVDTAMLAAVSGLSYTLSTLLKLEGYLSYVLPLPIVLSALRSGSKNSIKCLFVAFLLLFVLMGPVRATTYVLVYGFLSVALGISFRLQLPWSFGIPLCSIARLCGQGLYVLISSWITNENLLYLLISNAQTLLDNMSSWIGTSGSPSFLGVAIALASMLIVNSLFYVFMMHVLYTMILKNMGYKVNPLPQFLQRLAA